MTLLYILVGIVAYLAVGVAVSWVAVRMFGEPANDPELVVGTLLLAWPAVVVSLAVGCVGALLLWLLRRRQ